MSLRQCCLVVPSRRVRGEHAHMHRCHCTRIHRIHHQAESPRVVCNFFIRQHALHIKQWLNQICSEKQKEMSFQEQLQCLKPVAVLVSDQRSCSFQFYQDHGILKPLQPIISSQNQARNSAIFFSHVQVFCLLVFVLFQPNHKEVETFNPKGNQP